MANSVPLAAHHAVVSAPISSTNRRNYLFICSLLFFHLFLRAPVEGLAGGGPHIHGIDRTAFWLSMGSESAMTIANTLLILKV